MNLGWMSASFLVACLLCAFPFYQVVVLGIPIFYANGIDESSYLQYDYSRYVTEYAGVGRISQHVVNALHEVGLSGGQINLGFDLVAVTVLLAILPGIFQHLGVSRIQARVGSLIMIVSPVIVSSLNPVVDQLVRAVEGSSLRYWVVAPPFPEFQILRSPEPQFSIVLVAAAIRIGLRWKVLWPITVILPFLYVFVAVPVAIGFGALAIQNRLRCSALVAWLAAFGGISVGLFVFSFLMHDEVARFTGVGHQPILPVASVVALLVSTCIRSAECRSVARLASIATLLSVNTQIVAGWFLQPSNYDQYAGLIVLGGVFSIIMIERVSPRLRWFGAGAVCVVAAVVIFVDAYRVVAPVARQNAIWETQSRSLAVRSIRLASWLNLVKPRQEPTLLSVTGGYGRLIDRFGEEFRCVRSALGVDRELNPELQETFRTLDVVYGTNNTDYFRNHLGRPKEPPLSLPIVPGEPEKCRLRSEIVVR